MTNNLCLMGFRGLNRMRKLGLLKKQMSINLYKFYAGLFVHIPCIDSIPYGYVMYNNSAVIGALYV